MTGGELPTGVRVLHHDGDGPTPISQLLAASAVEPDPDREGIRILLACAASLLPRLPLDEFVMVAARLVPQLARFNPALVADVARRLGVA